MINNYKDLVKDQEKTREAIRMLETSTEDPMVFEQLTKDFTQLFKMINEFDEGNSNFDLHMNGSVGSFEKLKKTSTMMDQQITNMFLKIYGIDRIRFANMEQVYSPIVSGMGSMAKVREHLIERGMTANFADLLAARYIKK